MSGPAMTAAEVAEHLSYRTRRGEPNTRLVLRLARAAGDKGNGAFPEPIDARLDARLWRWSRVQVEAYGDGLWGDDEPSPSPLRRAS